MWIFLIILTLFQGLSTYMMCISIAQIKTKNKSSISIIREISPYKLIEDYTPDQEFNNIYLSILSRSLLFVTGFIGIIVCIIIHDIYFKIINSKEKINITDKEIIVSKTEEILDKYSFKNIFNIEYNSNNISEPNKYTFTGFSDNINKKIILLIDDIIANYFNYDEIKENLNKYNIELCDTSRFIINNKINKAYIDPFVFRENCSYYIKSNSIDDVIIEIGRKTKEIYNDSPQIICLCLESDYDKTKIFKHLCIPAKDFNNKPKEHISDIVNKICNLT